MISLPLVVSTFGIIFLAELPDKTALSSLMLAARHGARPVIIGAWLAMILQTIIAVLAGGVLNLLPAEPVRIFSGACFMLFAVFMIVRKEETNEAKELVREEEREVKRGRPVWFASFLVLFGTEWGDLSQLATAGIVAHQGHPLSVGIGAALALCTVVALAAVLGSRMSKVIPTKQLKIVSAILFALMGIAMIYSAFA
ncbi:MAG TPA: TMEM165/GDT1 family protein [Candidatus Paceibacterota bacterium]|nr:TMEM165/GDT1 family protein [Candidatus Paceibacterota bacterium]